MSDPALFTPAQRTLSDAFSGAWMAFVKTGNPNVAGPAWTPFKTAQSNVQEFALTGVQQSLTFAKEH